jgi:hypothetical protein
LRVLPQVAEEQRADAARAGSSRCRIDPEDDARRVAGPIVTVRRPEHAPPEVPEQAAGAVRCPTDVDSRAPEVGDHAGVRGPPDRTDEAGVRTARDRRHRTDVVAVEVRQDEQVDPVHPEQRQAGRQALGIVPRVDEGRPASAPEQGGVPLPDVAHRDTPTGRDRATDEDRGHRDRSHSRDGQERGEAEERRPDLRPDEHPDRDGSAHHPGSDNAGRSGRPRRRCARQRGGSVRDEPDPGSRHPPHGGEQPGTGRPHGREEARSQSDDGGHRGQDLRQQVRRYRVRRQGGGQGDRDRPASDLRGDRHRDGGGDRRPDPSSEQVGDGYGEDHDAGGREDREREGERAGHPGVDDEHADGGEGDQRDTAHRAPGQVHEQDHDRHHGRSCDRGVGTDEHHEREQHDHRQGGTQHPRSTDRATEQHDEADQDRAVRPGHRGQVGQRRGLHRLLGLGVQPGPVPDRESAEERPARLRQVGGDGGERRAGAGADAEQTGRAARDPHGPAGEQHDAGRRPGVVELQLPADGDDRPGRQHARPRLVERRHDPDRHPQGVLTGGTHHDRLERPDHGPVGGREVAVQPDTGLQAVSGRLPHDRRHPVRLPGDDGHGRQGDQQARREGQCRDRPDRVGPFAAEDAHEHGPGDDDRDGDDRGRRVRHADQHGDDGPDHGDRSRQPEVGE